MKTNKYIEMTAELLNYLSAYNPQENPYLYQLRETTDKLKYARLRTPTEQVTFLIFLTQFLSPHKILEIGTFTGYTTLALALATDEKTHITTCDINNVFPSIGIPYWNAANQHNKIELKIGSALKTLRNLLQQKKTFDLIYIDADKENTWQYFQLCLEILSERGLIIVDNTLRKGDVINRNSQNTQTQAMHEFNSLLTTWKNIHYCLLPFCDGITLISKRVSRPI